MNKLRLFVLLVSRDGLKHLFEYLCFLYVYNSPTARVNVRFILTRFSSPRLIELDSLTPSALIELSISMKPLFNSTTVFSLVIDTAHCCQPERVYAKGSLSHDLWRRDLMSS